MEQGGRNAVDLLLVLEATIGGTRRHLRDLATGLAARGMRVHVAYSVGRDPDFARDVVLFKECGIGCTEIPMRRGLSPFHDLAAVVRLRRLIRRLRPAALHLHSTKAGLVGRLAAIGTGVRVLYSPHCFAFEMDSLLRPLYRLAERALAPLTDILVAVCESEAAAARAVGYRPGRIRVVHNGVEASPPTPANRKDGSIAFIGRNCRQKGVDVMLEAFKRLKRIQPDARLTVMSDLDDGLRAAFASAGAEVLPFGTASDAAALLFRASILAMPSRWEAFPYLMLEALAAGVAVVASDVGGVGECITDHENGLLVPPNDPGELAMALQELLVSDQLRRRLAAAGAQSAARFTLSAMLDGITEAATSSPTQTRISPPTSQI